MENLEALDIELTAAELEELNNAIPQEKVDLATFPFSSYR